MKNQSIDEKLYIGVLGAHSCDRDIELLAERVGELIAQHDAILVCGGKGGVMEAACRGSQCAGGTTIGILPGIDASEGNAYLDYRIVTGLGSGRNMIIVRTVHAAIAVSGSYGTLSEISFCLKEGIPVVSLKSWDIPGIALVTESPEDAVDAALRTARF